MFLTLIPSLLSLSDLDYSKISTVYLNENKFIEASLSPEKIKTEIRPVINASSAIAIDLKSHEILFEKNINEQVPFASIAKLMVAVIIIEENNLEDIVTVTKNATRIEGAKVYLNPGEKIKFIDLLYLLLIPSGNDAAIALAEANSGTVEKFVEKMNKKAKILGMKDTFFTDPSGLDDINQKSTVLDIANLAIYALEKPLIRKIVREKQATVTSENAIIRNVENTNKLLDSYLDIEGMKTGTTDSAGQCLVSLARKDNREIVTVILHSEDRYKEAKTLIDWVWNAYKW